MKNRIVPVAAFAVAALLAACGGDDGSSTTTAPATTVAAATTSPASAAFNDADVEFAQGMIGHHEQAVEMAEVALDPPVGAGDAVKDLATRIKAAQDPEIALMTGWLTAWGKPVQMDTSGGHDMSSMDGMMSAEDMDALAMMSGAAFDTMWLQMMIQHHEGAITQSNTVKTSGSNPDVRVLADAIITAQQGEITEMQALLGN